MSDVPTMPIINNCDRTDECPSPIEHNERCPKFDAEFWSKVTWKPLGPSVYDFPTYEEEDR